MALAYFGLSVCDSLYGKAAQSFTVHYNQVLRWKIFWTVTLSAEAFNVKFKTCLIVGCTFLTC